MTRFALSAGEGRTQQKFFRDGERGKAGAPE